MHARRESTRGAAVQPHVPAGALPVGGDAILALQRTAGNAAVTRMLARSPAEHPLRQQIDAVRNVAALGSLDYERQYLRTDLALGIAKDRAKMLGTERVLDAMIAGGRAKPGPVAELTDDQKAAVNHRQAVLALVGSRGVRAGLEAATRTVKTRVRLEQVALVRQDIPIVQRQFRMQAALNAHAMLDQSEAGIVKELANYGLMTAHATPLVTKVSMEVVELNEAVDQWIERSRSRAEYRSPEARQARGGLTYRIEQLRVLQKEVVDLQGDYVQEYDESPMDARERRAYKQSIHKVTGVPMPKVPDIPPKAQALEQRINGARHKLEAAWIVAEREHPILAAHRGREGRHLEWIDLGGYAEPVEFGDDDTKRRLRIGQADKAQQTKSSLDSHERAAVRQAVRRLANIRRARLALKAGLLSPLKLPRVVKFTEKQLLIAPGSAWAMAVKELLDPEPGVFGQGLEFVKSVFDFAVLALMVLPTAVAPAAVLWEVGRNAYTAMEEYLKADLDATYSNTDLDIARSLSDRVPSLTGFVMALIAAGVALATLKSAFEAAAKARRGLLSGDEAALRELDELGRRHGLPSLGDDVARAEGVAAQGAAGARSTGSAAAAGPTYVHGSEAELRAALKSELQLVEQSSEASASVGFSSEIELLIKEIEQTDKPFAAKVRLYYEAKGNRKWVEDQVVRLWNEARANQITWKEQLQINLGANKRGVNKFNNKWGLTIEEGYDEFKAAILDDRVFLDEALQANEHGAWIHMFDEWLGDILLGPGEGLVFRKELARLQGSTRTARFPGVPEHEQPFWSRVWDALFDERFPAMHRPEVIAPILEKELGIKPPPPPPKRGS